jgi:transposase-like protein
LGCETNHSGACGRRYLGALTRLEINAEALEALIARHGHSPEAILGEEGLLAQLTKALVERALGAELSHHLKAGRSTAGEPEAVEGVAPAAPANCRNGFSKKVVLGDSGVLEITVPRDRHSSFEPRLVPKWHKRLAGFDQKIIALYARGMTVREIQALLEEQYHVEVSPDFISTVTDAVHAEVSEWQSRPLEKMYPLVFFDALRVRIRDEGTVRNKSVYLALGVAADGTREVLGLWIEQNEGAKFWLKVMNELRNRGVEDVLIAVVDGLKSFPEAITAVFAEASVQTCLVHLIRHSLSYCGWKDYQAVAAALKLIYRAENAEIAAQRLREFEAGEWGQKHPTIGANWRRAWEQVIPFFAYPAEVRKIISTTNAIESLNVQLRKIIKTRGHFPSDEAATKLLYLAVRNITAKWKAPPTGWRAAANQFAIQFGPRFHAAAAC